MNDIRSLIILNRKNTNASKMIISITTIILLALLIILQINYKKYYQIIGQVVEYNDNYKLALYINPYKTNVIKNNNSLIIDNKYYEYKIDFIEKDYIISESMNQYIKIYIDIDLKSSDKINNNILQVKILESDQKIICYLKNYIKKGVKKWKK